MVDSLTPLENLSDFIKNGNRYDLINFIESLSPHETARAISRLTNKEQSILFRLLRPEEAAELIEDIPDEQAADLVEEMPTEQAVAIMEELTEDHLVDLLGEMEENSSRNILSKMDRKDAEKVEILLKYEPDCAGGLMETDFLAYRRNLTIKDVHKDIQTNRNIYVHYQSQYIYVIDEEQRLDGVLRIHDLLFPSLETSLSKIMISSPLFVKDTANLSELEDFFEENHLISVPVVNEKKKIVGIVLRSAVEEAINKRKTSTFLKISGIIGGEEFRTMPLFSRSGRRLSWLSLNIVLNIIAASVIALYQDTLAAAITLAVFLPMVSDMSGCSGNQAIAVSMRELSLGLVRPTEIFWVLLKEAKIGIINGLILGILLGIVAFFWKSNPYLGLVVGGALAANTIVSVLLGGILPLVFKRLKLDPALVSSPILTTVTDMCGFFFVLSFASTILPQLSGM